MENMPLNVRQFQSPACGGIYDRDITVAIDGLNQSTVEATGSYA